MAVLSGVLHAQLGDVIVSQHRKETNSFLNVKRLFERAAMTRASSTVGRPPALSDDERRKRILEASEAVFDLRGYGDATMEEIAQGAGMAKKTVYKYFPDKAAVFWALINTHDDVLKAKICGNKSDDPRQQIRQILADLATFVLAPRQLRFMRLIISEARKSPELAERFHQECVEPTLTVFLRQVDPDNAIFHTHDGNAKALADMLLGAVLGPLQFRALLMPCDDDEVLAELDRRIELATEVIFSYLDKNARRSLNPSHTEITLY